MFHLRTPHLEDHPALARLGRDTFVETFGPLYSEEDLNTFLNEVYAESVIADELADPKLTHQVVEHEGDLIAFAKIGPVHVPVENPPPDAMELWQIYVRKEFLGHGLGKKLMAWSFEQFEAAGAGDLYVSVFSENERAIRFYRSHGFEKIGEYGFPVGGHVDLEWIMRKPATNPKSA